LNLSLIRSLIIESGDGFVEFGTAKDARNIVRAINRRAKDGSRSLKIGNRKVVVQVSSPGELMAALFPHVDGAVEWKDYTPHVIEVDTLFYQDQPRGVPLTGFCSSEELAALVKFAENQSRVSHPPSSCATLATLANLTTVRFCPAHSLPPVRVHHLHAAQVSVAHILPHPPCPAQETVRHCSSLHADSRLGS
jgi:hypothetical protein